MKTLICILLLIPVLGLAQMNTGAFHSFYKENFSLNQEKRQAAVINHSNTLVSSNLNFAGENKMLLDSSYLYYFDYKSDTITVIREYYEYDNHGNQTLFAKYIPCETCAVGTHKIESSYDEAGRLAMKITLYWDYTIKQWFKVQKDIYSYELNGTVINESGYWWDGKISLWKESWKTVKSYDEHGNILSEIYSRPDENTGMWISSAKNEYSYKNEKRILYISYKWDETASQWRNVLKEESEFDINGNEILHNNFIWENSTNQWVNNSKVIMTDSPESKITSYTQYRWDTITTQWINVRKEDYSFDSSGNKTLMLYYNWDNTSAKWKGVWKIESIYNDKGLLASKITNTESFDNSNEWHTRNKDYFEYDPAGNLILLTTYWNGATHGFYISDQSHYYYSLHNLTNQIDVKENIQVRIYPNPAHEAFTLEINDPSFTQCQIINSSGQLLQTMHVQMGINTFNISHLRQGMYFLKMKAKEETVVKKIIKD